MILPLISWYVTYLKQYHNQLLLNSSRRIVTRAEPHLFCHKLDVLVDGLKSCLAPSIFYFRQLTEIAIRELYVKGQYLGNHSYQTLPTFLGRFLSILAGKSSSIWKLHTIFIGTWPIFFILKLNLLFCKNINIMHKFNFFTSSIREQNGCLTPRECFFPLTGSKRLC